MVKRAGWLAVLPLMLVASCAGEGEETSAATVTEQITVTETAEPAPAPDAETVTVTVTAEPTEEPTTEETEEPTTEEPAEEAVPRSDGTLAWGESYEFGNDVEISIAQPEEIGITDDMWDLDDWDTAVQIEMTLVNRGSTPYDPSGLEVVMTAGGESTEETWAGSFDSMPNAAILPGREVSYTKGFGVNSTEDLVVQVNADWLSWDDEELAFWTDR